MAHDDSATSFPNGVAHHDSIWPASLGWFELSLPTVPQNLALDEVLLSDVNDGHSTAVLRFWESDKYCVILGRSNSAELEVNLDACRADGISVVRRCSGGGTVVLGPGCLAYSLFFPLNTTLRGAGISSVTQTLMVRMANALNHVLPDVVPRGTSDLAATDQKFSGNAQRWLANAFLHHGTILYQFDLPRIGRYLRTPSRQPDYRSGREHDKFVRNVDFSRDTLKSLITTAWHAMPTECDQQVVEQAKLLAESKYADTHWSVS